MNKIKVAHFASWLIMTFALTQFPKASQAQQAPSPIASSKLPPFPAYPDVPLGSWVYPALDKMEELDGIMGCSLFQKKASLKRYAITRYEVAVLTVRLRQQSDWRWVDQCPEGKLLGAAGVKDIMAAFECEFEPEITRLLLPRK